MGILVAAALGRMAVEEEGWETESLLSEDGEWESELEVRKRTISGREKVGSSGESGWVMDG